MDSIRRSNIPLPGATGPKGMHAAGPGDLDGDRMQPTPDSVAQDISETQGVRAFSAAMDQPISFASRIGTVWASEPDAQSGGTRLARIVVTPLVTATGEAAEALAAKFGEAPAAPRG